MATLGESSSAPPKSTDDKPVIVRVKRKAFQSPLDAFWLEINERPLKRPLLDFENLSISDSAEKGEFKTKKVLVQHVETLSSSEKTIDIVQSFVESSFADVSEGERKGEERRLTFKKGNKQDQLLSKARQEQEVLAKNARFEQIWRSRKGNQEVMHNKELDEMCRFYDVVRVDVEERSEEVKQQEDISLEDHMLLSSYLPLLREMIPSAASEIESDLHASMSKQAAGDYVYDFYAVRDDMDIVHEEASYPFPIVQVDDEDYYDGPDESEYETDDSNAENNPLNDYPDEISEEEEKSEASENESEELESIGESFKQAKQFWVPNFAYNSSMSSSPIPVDLFVSTKHPGLIGGDLGFANASGNVTFRLNRHSSPKNKRLFLDSTGNPLISIYHYRNGSWQGFTGEDNQKQCIFRVQRTVNKLTRTELEVFLVGENGEDSASKLKVKGCPFQKSCTISRGNDIVAPTSLMYKLRQLYAKRNKFRLTIFPGSDDHALVAALVVIFLD